MSYPKPDWFEKISEDLQKRQKVCDEGAILKYGKFDENNVPKMVPKMTMWKHKDKPIKNPYQDRSYDVFLMNNGKIQTTNSLIKTDAFYRTNCMKYHDRSFISKKTDKLKRYYNDNINFEGECNKVKGIWDPKAVNRSNKYGRGVCWTSKDQQECAANMSDEAIIPDYRKMPSSRATILQNKETCKLNPKCDYNENINDCVVNEKVVAVENIGPVTKPPSNMPYDITSPSSHIQKQLYNWYTEEDPSPAPKTDNLFGEGNRCVDAKPLEQQTRQSLNGVMTFLKKHMYTIDELKEITFPLNSVNVGKEYLNAHDVLKTAIGPENTSRLSTLHWNIDQTKKLMKKGNDESNSSFQRTIDLVKKDIEELWAGLTPDDLYVGIDDIDTYDNYYTYNREVVSDVVKTEKTFLPSISQSTVNMIMKNIQTVASSNRGLIAWHSTGSGKCHAKDTPLLMFDGSIKLVQDVVVGDTLMGDDSTPRNVLSLARGKDEMFDIIPLDYQSYKYTVNSEHILCLKKNNEVIEIEVNKYLQNYGPISTELKGYRVPNVEFPVQEVLVDPYDYGFQLLSPTNETIFLKTCYKINTRYIRLCVLAGIIDFCKGLTLFILKPTLVQDILFLARSLGFVARYANDQIFISGNKNNIIELPCKLVDLSCAEGDVLQTNIEVKYVGKGEYYGFTLDGNNRYLLGDFTVTHNTCTATGVMEAFWDSDMQIIFASSKDAVASNPPPNFHLCASRLFPRFQAAPFNGDVEIIGEHFEQKNVKFLSFAEMSNRIEKFENLKKLLLKDKINSKLATSETNKKIKKHGGAAYGSNQQALINYIHKRFDGTESKEKQILSACKMAKVLNLDDIVDLDNAVLIVDEVHNLFRPLANQKKEYEYAEKHITNPLMHPTLKIVILTATPGDNVRDVTKLINAVRDPTHVSIKPPNPDDPSSIMDFKNNIRGLISYFDMSNDKSKFPTVHDHGPIKYPMSTTQFAHYVEQYKKVTETNRNYDKLAKGNSLKKFWEGARKYSNMLYTFDKSLSLSEFSSKLPALLEKIHAFPTHKQYCYSAFYTKQGSGHGIRQIAKELEKKGYKQMKVSDAKTINKSGSIGSLKPAKRYIMAVQSEFDDGSKKDPGKNLHELLKIYNSPLNKNGELIHIMLASQGFNEGLDLKDVRHIHIFEPLVTMASDLQTIGRARRFCSHANLAQTEWTVEIHRYLSDFPLDMTLNKVAATQEGDAERMSLLGRKTELEAELALVSPMSRKKDTISLENNARNKELKLLLKEVDKKIKEIDVPVKKGRNKNVDISSVNNVDTFIYEEAQRRMKELFIIYHYMKEAAVDCMLLHKFHGNSSIHCLDAHVVQSVDTSKIVPSQLKDATKHFHKRK